MVEGGVCPYCEAEFQAKEIKIEVTEATGAFARLDEATWPCILHKLFEWSCDHMRRCYCSSLDSN
jgi:hypothetical protein